jgi:hypothetical protein
MVNIDYQKSFQKSTVLFYNSKRYAMLAFEQVHLSYENCQSSNFARSYGFDKEIDVIGLFTVIISLIFLCDT